MVNITFTQENFEYFLLILVRMSSFMFIAPFFGQSNTPSRIKLGLAFFVSLIVFNSVRNVELGYETTLGYAGYVVIESVVGLVIGFSAYMCANIITFAGQLMDMEIGLSMASLYDPSMKQQVTISGNLYYFLIMFLMIASDMHYFLLSAIIDSYKVIPIGGMQFGDSLFSSVVGFLGNYLAIGFRIVLPIFAVALIMNCVMGILTKVVPQIHMFSVGIQIKVLAGFFVMFVTVILLPSIAEFIFTTMQELVIKVLKGMY